MTSAVVLAAGPGTRLGELGRQLPKAMVPVAERPHLERLVGLLLGVGLNPVVVAVHHRADIIRRHFASGGWPGLVFVTTQQGGTGADLLACLPWVPHEPFVAWNGDTVVDLDLTALLSHAAREPDRGVVVLTRRTGVPNAGAWYVAHDGSVLVSREAVPATPAPERFAWRGSSTGVLVLTKTLLGPAEERRDQSLERTTLPDLISRGLLRAFDNGTRYFLDYGTPDGLARLSAENFVYPVGRVSGAGGTS